MSGISKKRISGKKLAVYIAGGVIAALFSIVTIVGNILAFGIFPNALISYFGMKGGGAENEGYKPEHYNVSDRR